MIFTFKSNVGGDVIMLENDGKQILSALGRNRNDKKGVISVEQLPGAINAIKAAIKGDKAIQRVTVEDDDDDDDDQTVQYVFLYQRASPFLELLERSLKKNEPVSWGL